MLLRAYPDMSITPLAKIAQLLHLRVRVLNVVLYRQSSRIVDANVAAKPEEYSTSLKC